MGVPSGEALPQLSSNFDLEVEELREMLARSRSHAEFVDRFFASYAAKEGCARWADKTPKNVRVAPWILRHFPQAKFVHVIRDGRDVVCSLRTHPRHRVVDGELVATGIRRPIEPCIQRWLNDVQSGLSLRNDPRYIELRYEDVIGDPEGALRRLFSALGEGWEPGVLRYHEISGPSRDPTRFPQNPEATRPLSKSALGRWRQDLSVEDLELFRKLAGPLMEKLGYEDVQPEQDSRLSEATGA